MQARFHKFFYVRNSETVFCPVCDSKLRVSGSRQRKLIDSSGSKVLLTIRRMKCEKCGRIHHELPDCLVPYKRFGAEAISEAVTSHISDSTFSGETSTLIRLRVWFKLFLDYVSRLREHFLLQYKTDISAIDLKTTGGLKRIVRTLCHSNLWPQTRLALTVQT